MARSSYLEIENEPMSIGDEFQAMFFDVMAKQYPKQAKCTIHDQYYDVEQGTDMLLGNMRLDPTLAFDAKDNMPFIAESSIPLTAFQDLSFGVRIANSFVDKEDRALGREGYHEFDDVAVVIGVNIKQGYEFHQYEDAIRANLEKYMEQIVEFAEDCRDDYKTLDMDEREILYAEPLVPNATYIPNDRISEEYKKMNENQNHVKDFGIGIYEAAEQSKDGDNTVNIDTFKKRLRESMEVNEIRALDEDIERLGAEASDIELSDVREESIEEPIKLSDIA